MTDLPAIQKASPARAADMKRVGSDCDSWIAERKWDGHRVLVHKDNAGVVHVHAGNGREKTHLVPHIAKACERLLPDTILDGEIVGPADSWGIVQSVLGSSTRHARSAEVEYVVFDILRVDGEDVRSHSWDQRRGVLEEIEAECLDIDGPVILTEVFPACEIEQRYNEIIARGGEGIIIKHRASTYLSGKRAKDWLKMKIVETADVVTIGATEGGGKFAGLIGAVRFGIYENGMLVEIGQCSGMTNAQREAFTEQHRNGTLAGQVMEIAYNGKVGPAPRHPQYKRLRTDKPAAECDRI